MSEQWVESADKQRTASRMKKIETEVSSKALSLLTPKSPVGDSHRAFCSCNLKVIFVGKNRQDVGLVWILCHFTLEHIMTLCYNVMSSHTKEGDIRYATTF